MKRAAIKHPATDRHINFTKATLTRLEAYLRQHFPGHRTLSMVVDRAVGEYLDRHERNGEL